jgi:hypothetical protein
MRSIPRDTFFNESFFFVNSNGLIAGVTSLTFGNSGDMQLKKKGASSFSDISSAVTVTEVGHGNYDFVSSDDGHTDTDGVMGFYFPANGAAVEQTIYAQVQYDVASVDAHISAMETTFTTGLAAGTVVLASATVEDDTPLDIYKSTHNNVTFYLSATMSEFNQQPIYFTAKKRPDDTGTLWTVQGSVTNTSSISAVFSMQPSDTSAVDISDVYLGEVQFRAANGSVIKNAVTLNVQVKPTLKTS